MSTITLHVLGDIFRQLWLFKCMLHLTVVGRLNERVDNDKVLNVILKEMKIKSMLGQILYQQTRLINHVSSM
jgi:hypothetical protein